MATDRYTDILRDQYSRPIAGAYVSVITPAGAAAVLYDDDAQPLENPFTTGTDGVFAFNAAPGTYELQYRYGGRLVETQFVFVGPPLQGLTPETLALLADPNAADVIGFDPGTGLYSFVGQKLRQVLSVKDYGAIGDGTSHPLSEGYSTLAAAQAVYPHATSLSDEVDWAAIQAAMNDLVANAALFFPATPFAYYRCNRGLLIPTLGGVRYYGEGRLASRIRLVNGGASTDLFSRADTSTADSNNINNIQFQHLGFEASGASRHCFNWLSMSRSSFTDGWVNGFGGDGLRLASSIILAIDRVTFASNANGIKQVDTNWTGCNGLSVGEGTYFSLHTERAIDLGAGGSALSLRGIYESNALGGINLGQDCADVEIVGYFENNNSALTNSEDIFIGRTSTCTNINVHSSYFNGDTDASDYYYPIRANFARGCDISNNSLNIGSKFAKFESANPSGNKFGKLNLVNGSFKSSDQTQPTLNFNSGSLATFANARNRLAHDFNAGAVPAYPMSLVPNEDLTTDWTTTLTGSSAYSSSSNGARTAYLLQRNGGTATISKTLTVGARENSEVKGRFVTFAVDVYVDNATSRGFTLTLEDSGGSGTTQTYSASGSQNDGPQTFYITGIWANPAGIKATIAATVDGDFYLTNARWYVSADPAAIV